MCDNARDNVTRVWKGMFSRRVCESNLEVTIIAIKQWLWSCLLYYYLVNHESDHIAHIRDAVRSPDDAVDKAMRVWKYMDQTCQRIKSESL